MLKRGMKMIVFVCDRLPNIEGRIDHRPIAVFRNMKDTVKFLRILAANGIYACVKNLEGD